MTSCSICNTEHQWSINCKDHRHLAKLQEGILKQLEEIKELEKEVFELKEN